MHSYTKMQTNYITSHYIVFWGVFASQYLFYRFLAGKFLALVDNVSVSNISKDLHFVAIIFH